MNPRNKVSKSKNQLRLENKRLKSNSFSLYGKILAKLFLSNRKYEFLRPLSDALRRKDYKTLISLSDSLSKQKYLDADEHFVANQFALLIGKYPWNPKLLGLDPEKAAYESFCKSERRNSRINRKFSHFMIDPSRDRFRKEGKLAMAYIRSVIGSRVPYNLIFRNSDFGSGASLGVHGDLTHVVKKLTAEVWTITPGAIHHAFGGIMRNFHYQELLLERRGPNALYDLDYSRIFEKYIERLSIVDYNKLSFVPKKVTIHRSIAIEPLWTGFVQKGVDQVLRSELLNAGLDLGDQSRNQEMARKGSLDNSPEGWVTIDIRNASNSVALKPVEYLFPEEWFSLFVRTRSPKYIYDGVVKPYHMLCSMGNGFCFPVETLIFASICIACGCGEIDVDFRVYGDDIIVRRKFADKVIMMLRHYGYAINTDKTFLEGEFRESCGSDWFGGEDVRPFTLDYALDSVQNIFKFLNLSLRNERTKAFFRGVRSLLIESVHVNFRFIRPFTGTPDSAIDTTGDEHLTCKHCTFKNGRWSWKVLVHKPVIDFKSIRNVQNEPWLIGVALKGNESIPNGRLRGLPSVAYRRRTRTEVARESYASTSNWLPPRMELR